MGHTVSTYNDIKMKSIEFLRSLYASSGLSVRPKTKLSKIEQLKVVIEAWGMNPDEILTREALSMPHRTVVDSEKGLRAQIWTKNLRSLIARISS